MKVKFYFEDLMIEEICLDYFKRLYDKKESNEIAVYETIEAYKEVLDSNDIQGHLSWIALAYYQWSLGRLITDLKERAEKEYELFLLKIDEFMKVDLTKNYLDKTFAPNITHKIVLSQIKKMISSLSLPNSEKKLRQFGYQSKMKKLIDRGIYSYKINCEKFGLNSESCYIYFFVDEEQSNNRSQNYPTMIYIYNLFSINEILSIDTIQEFSIIPSHFYYPPATQAKIDEVNAWSMKNFGGLGLSYGYHYSWTMTSRYPEIGYQKTKFLGKPQYLILPKGEYQERYRYRSSSLTDFDDLDGTLLSRMKGYKSNNLPHFVDNQILIDEKINEFEIWDLDKNELRPKK